MNAYLLNQLAKARADEMLRVAEQRRRARGFRRYRGPGDENQAGEIADARLDSRPLGLPSRDRSRCVTAATRGLTSGPRVD